MIKVTLISCISMILYLLNESAIVHSDCNVCNAATNRTCISKWEYRECNEDNQPFGNVYQCNEGYYCSILGTCVENIDLSECNECGNCNENKTFACIDTKTFALCLGTDDASEIRSQCTDGLTCNYQNAGICSNGPATCSYRDDTMEEPTTTTTTTTSTTPSPSLNPNGFCQAIQKEGRFPIGTNAQTTCRQYIHCKKIGASWYGPIYNCPGETYYDSSTRQCVSQIPSTCSDTVIGLSFRNIILE